MKPNYLFHFIENIRKNQRVILYNNILEIDKDDLSETVSFLKNEYENEKLNYPYHAPNFDTDAAIYSAKITYYIAQLILYRNIDITDTQKYFTPFQKSLEASSILTADLLFRFLPQFHLELMKIDFEDGLMQEVINLMNTWHYSSIAFHKESNHLDTIEWYNNECYQQLYIDRIIEVKNHYLADHPKIKPYIKGHLSIYKKHYWNHLILSDHE